MADTTTNAALDNYMKYLSNNGTSTTTNYFDSDEFKAFQGLSYDLANKAEERDLRLMDKAAIKRDQEYDRNYRQASNLYNIGSKTSLEL
jgi:hypothetical protein